MSDPADPDQRRSPREPAPVQPRIGDAERDEAISCLQEHMAQGRLDQLEFDERLTRAFAARTAGDLQPLFEDLPAPRPAGALARTDPAGPPPWAAAPSNRRARRPGPGRTGAGAPVGGGHPDRGLAVAILLSVLTSFEFWWIWVVAGVVTYVLRRAYAPKPPDDPEGRPAVHR